MEEKETRGKGKVAPRVRAEPLKNTVRVNTTPVDDGKGKSDEAEDVTQDEEREVQDAVAPGAGRKRSQVMGKNGMLKSIRIKVTENKTDEGEGGREGGRDGEQIRAGAGEKRRRVDEGGSTIKEGQKKQGSVKRRRVEPDAGEEEEEDDRIDVDKFVQRATGSGGT